MTKEQCIAWLQQHQDVLKISSIGAKAGIPRLHHIVKNIPDGRGYYLTLADKHLPALIKEIEKIRK